MLFFSVFKTLQGREITVELKNGLIVRGKLHSIDPYHNIKLENITVVHASHHPYLLGVTHLFVRGSTIRYIQLPADAVDLPLLRDACRREARRVKSMTLDAPPKH